MERTPRPDRLITWLALLAPIVFVIHVVEEAPTFVSWFNAHVEPDITEGSFLRVNGTGFVITVFLGAVLAATRDSVSALLFLGWLAFLMLANGLFHLVATVVDRRYCPGAVTAAVLYLPYFAVFFWAVLKRLRIPMGVAVVVSVLGAIPMAAHGYLIVFRGSRLF